MTDVAATRTTWRASAEHKAAQAWRFLRLYVFTFTGQVLLQIVSTALAGGVDITHLDQKALTALVVPAAEVVWRQKHPALTASEVTAPDVTPTAADDAPVVPDDSAAPAPIGDLGGDAAP